MNQQAIQMLLGDLRPDERMELEQAISYLTEHAGNNPPEGSVARVINQLSPNVRSRFATLSELLETPRMVPFAHKYSEAEHAQNLGLDPQITNIVKAQLDDDAITAGLQRSMGTDASAAYGKEPAPLTAREQLAAAIDAHGGHRQADFIPAMANASAHVPMKDAIRTITKEYSK